ncbi:hypothetical protein COO60DRAFT_1460990 [Scenedesmus sp. NREL 46B-D3]|nr:hypothetical protein COO60DRAFT_1460990 [Scenedesmus sp. NREL 46B-D3]
MLQSSVDQPGRRALCFAEADSDPDDPQEQRQQQHQPILNLSDACSQQLVAHWTEMICHVSVLFPDPTRPGAETAFVRSAGTIEELSAPSKRVSSRQQTAIYRGAYISARAHVTVTAVFATAVLPRLQYTSLCCAGSTVLVPHEALAPGDFKSFWCCTASKALMALSCSAAQLCRGLWRCAKQGGKEAAASLNVVVTGMQHADVLSVYSKEEPTWRGTPGCPGASPQARECDVQLHKPQSHPASLHYSWTGARSINFRYNWSPEVQRGQLVHGTVMGFKATDPNGVELPETFEREISCLHVDSMESVFKVGDAAWATVIKVEDNHAATVLLSSRGLESRPGMMLWEPQEVNAAAERAPAAGEGRRHCSGGAACHSGTG